MLWLLFFLINPKASARPLTFSECIELVAKSNPDLLAAESNLRSVEEKWGGSYSAFFPSINATLGMNKSDPPGSYNPSYTSGLSVSYNLFSGLRDAASIRYARINFEIAQANLDLIRAKVSALLRQAFAQYLYARENVKLTAAIRERRSQNERLVRAQYESGRENEGSALFSRSLLDQAQFDERVARDILTLAAQGLSHVLGTDSTELEAQGEIPLNAPPEDGFLESKIKSLLLLTPTHRAAVSKIELAESALDISRSGFFPSLDLNGSLGYTGSAPTVTDNKQVAMGLTLTLPLFSGLSTYRDYRSSARLAEASIQNQNSSDFDTLNSLRQTLLSFQQSIQKLKVDLTVLNAATIRATIARKRYNTGLLAFEQWDIIETDLINRQKNALLSKRDRILSESNYRQAQGLGDFP